MNERRAVNAMIEMTTLSLGHPGLNAPIEAVAAWYRAKGRLHEQLAAHGGRDSAAERTYAATSYAHVHRLELGCPPTQQAA